MKSNKKRVRERKIAGRNIRGLVFLGLFLLLGTCVTAGRWLYTRNIKIYTEHAYSFAELLADNISGILPTKFMETGKKDDDYFNIRYTLMTASIFESEFRDFYLVIPTEDDLVYISEIYHNTDETDGEFSNQQAGFLEHRPYAPGEKEAMMQVLSDEKNGRHDDRKLFIGIRSLKGERLATALMPLQTLDGEVPALVGVDISLAAIWRSLSVMFLHLALVIAVITSIGTVVWYRAMNRTMIRPITTLKKETEGLVDRLDSGEPFVSDVHTGDELEALAHSFEEMDRNLKQHVRENMAITAEKERLNTELDLARRIQADMLPRIFPPYPDRPEFDLFASMAPAKEVGGDFYDFFLVDDRRLGLVIADVSGKGVPAALFMVIAKTLIKSRALQGESPSEILHNVNEQLCEGNEAELFVTVWLAIIDLDTGRGVAANAGHEHPVLCRAGDEFRLVEYPHSPPVAFMDGMSFAEHTFEMHPGDKLFVYTDGVPEASDASLEQFKTARMLTALNRNPEASPEELLHTVRKDIDAFVGEAPQFDDLTMMCLVYRGQPGAAEQTAGTGGVEA